MTEKTTKIPRKVFSIKLAKDASWGKVSEKIDHLLGNVAKFLADDKEAVLAEIQAFRPEEVIILQEMPEIVNLQNGRRPGDAFVWEINQWVRTDASMAKIGGETDYDYPTTNISVVTYEVSKGSWLVHFMFEADDFDRIYTTRKKRVEIFGLDLPDKFIDFLFELNVKNHEPRD